jgi:hypothetical protein
VFAPASAGFGGDAEVCLDPGLRRDDVCFVGPGSPNSPSPRWRSGSRRVSHGGTFSSRVSGAHPSPLWPGLARPFRGQAFFRLDKWPWMIACRCEASLRDEGSHSVHRERRRCGVGRPSCNRRRVWIPAFAGMTFVLWDPAAQTHRHPDGDRGPDAFHTGDARAGVRCPPITSMAGLGSAIQGSGILPFGQVALDDRLSMRSIAPR